MSPWNMVKAFVLFVLGPFTKVFAYFKLRRAILRQPKIIHSFDAAPPPVDPMTFLFLPLLVLVAVIAFLNQFVNPRLNVPPDPISRTIETAKSQHRNIDAAVMNQPWFAEVSSTDYDAVKKRWDFVRNLFTLLSTYIHWFLQPFLFQIAMQLYALVLHLRSKPPLPSLRKASLLHIYFVGSLLIVPTTFSFIGEYAFQVIGGFHQWSAAEFYTVIFWFHKLLLVWVMFGIMLYSARIMAPLFADKIVNPVRSTVGLAFYTFAALVGANVAAGQLVRLIQFVSLQHWFGT